VKVEILESARRDLVDGFYFYEKQADGIGSYFLESMYSNVDSLRDNAGIHPVLFGEYHAMRGQSPFKMHAAFI
jgi:hypothetical protein